MVYRIIQFWCPKIHKIAQLSPYFICTRKIITHKTEVAGVMTANTKT